MTDTPIGVVAFRFSAYCGAMTKTTAEQWNTEAGLMLPAWTFADRIRKIRRDAGLTQADFAAALEISKSSLQNYEAEVSTPRHNDQYMIATACETEFSVPAWWTLGHAEPVDLLTLLKGAHRSTLVRSYLTAVRRFVVRWQRRRRLGPLAVVVELDEHRLARAS